MIGINRNIINNGSYIGKIENDKYIFIKIEYKKLFQKLDKLQDLIFCICSIKSLIIIFKNLFCFF